MTEKRKLLIILMYILGQWVKKLTKKFSTNNNANYLKYLTKVNKEIIAFNFVHEAKTNKFIERPPTRKVVDLIISQISGSEDYVTPSVFH